MEITTAIASAGHVDDISRIGYEAFRRIAQTHGFQPDFPNVGLAKQVYKMLVERMDYYGIVAVVNGRVVGSNFISTTDAISGIGPLSVDPTYQGQGIGRLLMEHVLNYARNHEIDRVRLLQDTHNAASLALYSSLGFEVRDIVALIATVPALQADFSIRRAGEADVPKIDSLTVSATGASRKNEIILAIRYGLPTLIREREGKIAGYLIPGLVGHGVAHTTDDSLALLLDSARSVPSGYAKVFCPLRHSDLFRRLITAGAEIEKTLTYMTLGPYHHPTGIYTPSAGY